MNWQMLYYFDLVVGSILCWQQREGVVGVYIQIDYFIGVFYVIVIDIVDYGGWLVDMYMCQLSFFKVSIDLQVGCWDYCYQWCGGVDLCVRLY